MIRTALRVTRHQKRDAVTAKTFDTRVKNEMAEDQAAKAKERFIKRVATQQHAIMQVLTAEQPEKLTTMQAEKQAQRSAKMSNFASKRGSWWAVKEFTKNQFI